MAISRRNGISSEIYKFIETRLHTKFSCCVYRADQFYIKKVVRADLFCHQLYLTLFSFLFILIARMESG